MRSLAGDLSQHEMQLLLLTCLLLLVAAQAAAPDLDGNRGGMNLGAIEDSSRPNTFLQQLNQFLDWFKELYEKIMKIFSPKVNDNGSVDVEASESSESQIFHDAFSSFPSEESEKPEISSSSSSEVMMMDWAEPESNPFSYIQKNHEKDLVFCIHRNTNKNVVVYAANLDTNGQLVEDNPVKPYWIMFEQDGHPTEGLNVIEKHLAYGVSSSPGQVEGHFKISFIALKDRKLDLFIQDGQMTFRGVLNGQPDCTFERVFVQSTTSSWGLPTCEYVKIHGRDPEGNVVTETIVKNSRSHLD